jgi:hypothetical protein
MIRILIALLLLSSNAYGVNVKSQHTDERGVRIVASDGRIFAMTTQQILDQYRRTQGTSPQRRVLMQTWLAEQVELALGAEQIPREMVFSLLHVDPDGVNRSGRYESLGIGTE